MDILALNKSLIERTDLDLSFFVGVPDSQLKALCNCLINECGICNKHIIAANEGNAVGIAAGYHLATGKIPVVYMQNSGIGNIVNPVASLLNEKVYGIPCIFVVGWRGEPGVHDEPQHVFQGEITIKLLEDIGIETFIVSKNTTTSDIVNKLNDFKNSFKQGKSLAFVVQKGALDYCEKVSYSNQNTMKREEIVKKIVEVAQDDIIVSTTGKTSRELFEIRVNNGESHEKDFLTVGSMGHSSSIALGIALSKPQSKVWCIDGDGAAIMHLGSMNTIAKANPNNLIHVVINNEAHESVGGMPTPATSSNMSMIAKGCGYRKIYEAQDFYQLEKILVQAKECEELTFIEVKCAIGGRENLGRPTSSPSENKNDFMSYLKTKK